MFVCLSPQSSLPLVPFSHPTVHHVSICGVPTRASAWYVRGPSLFVRAGRACVRAVGPYRPSVHPTCMCVVFARLCHLFVSQASPSIPSMCYPCLSLRSSHASVWSILALHELDRPACPSVALVRLSRLSVCPPRPSAVLVSPSCPTVHPFHPSHLWLHAFFSFHPFCLSVPSPHLSRLCLFPASRSVLPVRSSR